MIDENFLFENNITISKITFSYDFPYNYKYYKETKRGTPQNYHRDKFINSINNQLLKLCDGTNLILNRPHYIIELKYLYNNKYYNININNERIIFNNIDYNIVNDLTILILNLIGYNLIEMDKYQTYNILYKINFESCYINKYINIHYNFKSDDNDNIKINKPSYIINIPPKKSLIKLFNKKYQIESKLYLKGRNKLLIQQNNKFCSDDNFIKFYKYIKSTIILPGLLQYLHNDKYSMFSYLFLEIINIINTYLQ